MAAAAAAASLAAPASSAATTMTMTTMTTAATAPLASFPSPAFFGMADVSVLSPVDQPWRFAKRAAHCAAGWGGFSLAWQLAFERYAAFLEEKGYLEREAHEPAVPRLRMLWQSLFGIAGTALPSALVQAYFNPEWTHGASPFGALALVPYIFLYVLFFDAYYYWGHRLCHSVPWLYRLVHKTHHLPQASLDAGSTSYMTFLEGFLLSGLPFAPNLLIPILFFRGNFWVAALTYYTVLCLFYLGHAGCTIKKDILPIFLLNPYLIVLGVTANASRPENHTAHHERVVCNYAVFFRLWDEACGTAAEGPRRRRGAGKGGMAALEQEKAGSGSGGAGGGGRVGGVAGGGRTKQLPISWRVMLYNALSFFSFFALPLLLAAAPMVPPRVLVALALACAGGPALFRAEAACLRLAGLTCLATRLGFWDGLRRDLRVSVEREQEGGARSAAAAAAAVSALDAAFPPSSPRTAELVAVVSLPRHLSAPLLTSGSGGRGGGSLKQQMKRSLGGGGGHGDGDDDGALGGLNGMGSPLARAALGHLSGDDECLLGCASPEGGVARPRSPLIASLRHRAPREREVMEGDGFVSEEEEHPQEEEGEEARALLLGASRRGAAGRPARGGGGGGGGDEKKHQAPPNLYVYHPRGDLMRGAFFAFAARGRDAEHPLSSARDVRLALPPAAAAVLMRLPLVRSLVALLGGVHPACVAAALRSGASVAVCLPGPSPRGPPRRRGPVDANGDAHADVAKVAEAEAAKKAAKKAAQAAVPAFVRDALASGAALVPVVAVGEAELAGRLPLRDKFVMPSRPGCPVRVVFGEPVCAGEGESAQALRERFAGALAALAARHGAPPPEPADV